MCIYSNSVCVVMMLMHVSFVLVFGYLILVLIDCLSLTALLQIQASPKGQLVFDKLLKACSEAVWKGESILVLNQVQVDPPYGPEQCKIIAQRSATGKKALDDGSLERIKKIVAAAANNNSS
jgi:hypothetical protein